MAYRYIAYNEERQLVRGELEVASEEQATEVLGYAGYQVVNLKEVTAFPLLERIQHYMERIKPTDLVLFYIQLALLLETGMNIATAIEILGEQSTSGYFKRVLKQVVSDLRGGSQLSAAMSKHPKVFNSMHCQSLKVGEQSGNLEAMLRQVSEHMERDIKSAKGVKNAMTYPILVGVVGVIVIGIIVAFVLPSFEKLYASFGAELPALTQFIIDVGKALQANALYIFLAAIAIAAAAYSYIRTPAGRYKWDKLSLKLFLVGRINHMNELARISRSVSLLFRAGLPLTEIIALVIEASKNRLIIEALTEVRENMIGGEGLSKPMGNNPIFLPMFVQMVKVGEETGNLDSTLISVAKAYEAEAEEKTRSLIAMIQPAMIIVMGAMVGLLALSLVSAMYSMYTKMT